MATLRGHMTNGPLDRFDRHQRRLGFTAVTIQRRRAVVSAFARWLVPTALEDASATDIETWLDSRPLAARSRYTYLSYLAAFYDMDAGYNPARELRRPRLPKHLPRPVRHADLAAALRTADPRMRCWLTLAAFQGLRCAEIARLRREEILDTEDPPVLTIRNGKGNKDGVMALNIVAEKALRSYGLPPRGPMWRTARGTPMTGNLVSCHINRFLHDLGVSETAHGLRAFFGTLIYRRTHDPLLTKEAMRHSSFATTEGYIALEIDETKAELIRNLTIDDEPHSPPTLF